MDEKFNFNYVWIIIIMLVVIIALIVGASLYAYGFQNGQFTTESIIHSYGNCTLY